MTKKQMAIVIFALALAIAAVTPVVAAPAVGFGQLYYEDTVVRTVVPPATMSKEGTDDFYAVPDQMAVVAVAPGDKDYRGGKWRFHAVSWKVDPYLLTSAAAVLAAEDAGDVTITRVPENDFKCPIQP